MSESTRDEVAARAEDLSASLDPSLREFLSLETGRAKALQLVLAWQIARTLQQPCESLNDLATLFKLLSSDAFEPIAQTRALIELARISSTLACSVGATSTDPGLRTLCLGLARQCGCAATKLQQHVLWGE